MLMDNSDFTLLTQQIELLRRQIETAQGNVDQFSAKSPTNEDLKVWRDMLDELSVCQEALNLQHEQLEKERRHYQDLFNFAPDGYVVTDTAGVMRHVNEAATTLLGMARQWLANKSIVLFIGQEERRQFRTDINLLLTERRRRHWEARLHPYNRPPFPASILAGPLIDAAGKVHSLLWVIRDVSPQKWMEEELRKGSQELAQQVTERTAQLVAANENLRAEIVSRQHAQAQLIENERLAVLGVTAEKVAHEIGNALNNLSTTVQMQRYHINTHTTLDDATLTTTMNDLQQQLRKLSETVHAWRSLAQQSRLQLEPTDLSALISETLDNHALHCAEQGVEMVRELPLDLPQVKTDREKLRRALHNVYANALNVMPTGGILTVSVSQTKEHMTINVGDTGPSLSLPTGINLFDLLTTTLPPGVGLGLAIAEQIISAHGGKITYESDPSTGTIIRLTLPLEK